MTSSDSTHTGPWDTQASLSPSHLEGAGDTYAYNHTFYPDQSYPLVEQVEDSAGPGSASAFSQFTSDAHNYNCHHPSRFFVYNKSNTTLQPHFDGLEQTDVKPTRLDVQVGPGNIGYQYESTSLSPSWNTPPSSASTDATCSCHSPVYSNGNHSYDSESPQSSTLFDYSGLFIKGHPYGYLAGSENDDGRYLSEQPNAFRELYHDPSEPSTSCTISPEILKPKHEEDSQSILYSFDPPASSCCPDYLPPKKTKVASPRVLAASKKRRRPSKPGAKLYSCSQCCETFTARHNLNNHVNSHSGIRPYSCNACGFSFGTKHVLTRHQKTCQPFLMHASTSLTHYVN